MLRRVLQCKNMLQPIYILLVAWRKKGFLHLLLGNPCAVIGNADIGNAASLISIMTAGQARRNGVFRQPFTTDFEILLLLPQFY